MYIYEFIYNGDYKEIINDKKDRIKEIIEELIFPHEYADFYSDTEAFINSKLEDGYTVKKATKKIYYITTSQRGWDTCDSGVYCNYTEKLVLEDIIKDMGMHYSDSAIEYIGKATKDLEIGSICTSFNAG